MKTNTIKVTNQILGVVDVMIFRVIKTILKKNSVIKKKELMKEIKKRTGLKFSTIKEQLNYFEVEGRVSKVNGSYIINNTINEIKV